MSKRTKTDNALKNPKDFWPTPFKPIRKLAEVLPPFTVYEEPCAGDGAILRGLYDHLCGDAYDFMPRAIGIRGADALTVRPKYLVITNPPYRRSLLQPLLDHWIGRHECWLLLPLDMASNVWTNPYMRYVDRILPLGRVSWMQNGKAGMENSCWFHFGLDNVGLILHRA